MVSAIHQHVPAIGIHMLFLLEHPTHLPLHPTPLGCYRALVLSSLHHTANSHWLSILHMVMHMFQCYSLKSFHPLLLPLFPSLFFMSVSPLLP